MEIIQKTEITENPILIERHCKEMKIPSLFELISFANNDEQTNIKNLS